MRYLLLSGTGRCGSSLVAELVARHPEVGFTSNVDDRLPVRRLGWANNEVYRRVPPRFTRKGRLRFAPSEGWRSLEREVSPLVSRPSRDLLASDATPWLSARVARWFDDRARAQGKPVFLHKFTGWPRYGLVEASLSGDGGDGGDVRYVHVVRDGRAVASSLVQMPWWEGHRSADGAVYGPLPVADREAWERSGRSFVLLAGLAWKQLVDAHEAAAAKLPAERFRTLRYEDLLDDPAGTLVDLLAWVGLDADHRFRAALEASAVTGGRRDAWRHDLAGDDVALLEQSLGEHLARYGYGP